MAYTGTGVTNFKMVNGYRTREGAGIHLELFFAPRELEALRRIVDRMSDAGGKPEDVIRARAIDHLRRAIFVAEDVYRKKLAEERRREDEAKKREVH